ncbi:BLUF domain-containing protein [Sphingomonas sp. R86520]|uniref:BLUF domain-containing protein n=1 Tax=Sphingomonas sp. R86520 TaxID=3093859 RepID=UPI0036D3C384
MTLLSLLYVSRSTIAASVAEAAVLDIVATAHRRNPLLNLTGALIFTGSNFAQIFEGPTASVDLMMGSIESDPRHKDIVVADRLPALHRRFDEWSMAYSGRVRFVERHITALFDPAAGMQKGEAAKQLRALIYEFSL